MKSPVEEIGQTWPPVVVGEYLRTWVVGSRRGEEEENLSADLESVAVELLRVLSVLSLVSLGYRKSVRGLGGVLAGLGEAEASAAALSFSVRKSRKLS